MKAKIITICSLLLVVSLFMFFSFSKNKNVNTMAFSAYNNNLSKMDDSTSLLFEVKKVEFEEVVEEQEEKVEEVVEEFVVETPAVVVEEPPVEEVKEEPKQEEEQEVVSLSEEREVLQTVVGTLTGYGADCVGCSGTTSSGFDLTKSIYYEDSEYGTVRILAADPSFPFYSIVRVSNVPTMEDFIGIVLDRGGNVGFGRGTLFDLAYFSEGDPNLVPLTRNVTFELLRSGR